MKLARTIRFDRSDLNVFPRVADEGEWALVGTFCFAGLNEEAISGKVKQAFSNGFLGLQSFGFSTLVSVVTLKSDEIDKIKMQLSEIFISEFGAPNKTDAMTAATEEVNFMAELCVGHEVGTLLAVQRSWGENGISESFRSLPKSDSCAEQKIWTVVDEDDTSAIVETKVGK